MDHDELCPMQEPEPGDTVRQSSCLCYLIAKVRTDERERYQGRRDGMMRALSEELLHVRSKTLADLYAKVEVLSGKPNGKNWIRRDKVLDLIDGSE